MIITNVWNDTPFSIGLSGGFVTNGGYVEIFFAGSAFANSGGGLIGANLLIDGNIVTTAKVFTNEALSHKALVPALLVVKLAAGSHTATLSAATPNTRMDTNDFFTLAITELSFS